MPIKTGQLNYYFTLLAVISWLAYSIPPLRWVYGGANLSTFYGENIGYHFFWSMRFVDGALNDVIIPSQGAVMAIIQNIYYISGKHFTSDLLQQTNIFGYLTIATPLIGWLFLLLWISWDNYLPKSTRLGLIFTPLIFGLINHTLFAYQLYPDYHSYVKLFLFGTFYYYLKNFIYKTPTFSAFIVFGILTGTIGALKLPIIIFPIGLFLSYFVSTTNYKKNIYFLIKFIAVVIITFFSYFLILFKCNLSSIYDFFYSILHVAGTSSPMVIGDFWPTDYLSIDWLANPNLNLIILFTIFIVFALIQAIVLNKFKSKSLVILFITALITFLVTIKRGGGASYVDNIVIITLLILLTSSYPESKLRNSLSYAVAILFIAWPLTWIFSSKLNALPNYQTNNFLLNALTNGGDWQRPIYAWNDKQDLPIYVIVPSNSYALGTLEDMIMRGFSNSNQGWYESNINPSLIKLFPKHKFGSYDMQLPNRPFVFQFIAAENPFPLVDKDELEKHLRNMDRLMKGYNSGPCFEVIQPLVGATVKSCVMTPKTIS
ncbi:hypothetical protein [Polynucleobacter sp. IMCC 29146]|uniref:hypothetical protein n=1 Tax=Polynucleobacter sp. IMCC 29146 TaxID=2780953 RepID=UPI001F2E4B3C|nr:hypothetical protein [Polynucleobacter sp. IMCC 29146]MCE7530708.1 hypothetical protein [Polynucleobacter sp. IMCC 29146]